jgi:hypothetical protein
MQTVIVGMGEIGSAFYDVLRTKYEVYGYDVIEHKRQGKPRTFCDIAHICIPYNDSFIVAVEGCLVDLKPKEIIIHSSVPPGTTMKLQSRHPAALFAYSPFRGVHKRMGFDMLRYMKYWAGDKEPKLFVEQMQKCKVPVKPWNDTPVSLELAKLWMDVTYYGWLIIFAQHTKVLAERFGVDEKKLWEFTDDIQRFLGNRPRMFSGDGIGGHCVMQDKDLLNDAFLDAVFSHDEYYRRNLKNGS